MGFARTRAVALAGVTGHLVTVEAHLADGLPAMTLSGLPDAACARAPDRVRAAAASTDVRLEQRRWTINLSPAALPKQGSGFDLAVAVAQLAAQGSLPPAVTANLVHVGELGLDGSVRHVPGVLPMVMAAVAAGATDVVVPRASAGEAALVPGARVRSVATLAELLELHRALQAGEAVPVAEVPPSGRSGGQREVPDLQDVVGQAEARRALEVAAAGRHHMLLVGPPGAGKTMLAERLPGLLPPLTAEQALEVTAVHSVLGATGSTTQLVTRAPFVAPHHTASPAAVVGGGSGRVAPGAISRAHRGVLFLDEAPEFRRDVLEGLRQPLESGQVVIARAHRQLRFPARFQLVAAANPCPCGQAVGKGRDCRCTPQARRTYLARLSGPLLDRVDLRVSVRAPGRAALAGPTGETSATVAARVEAARERQARRWAGHPWSVNAEVPGPVLRDGERRLPPAVTRDLARALDLGRLTLRGYDRCLRIGWTISDLAGADGPGREHLAEALGLRGAQEVAA
ncbi:YifB family Mg chelatase-like AAA ATPase [Ornithinicoccus halotolerans]|uniref:YifB family Mg chelatase-like AAA ATPase n=1 Tax=Ornithinicoccus halotolerans TaxID=1748220 RepID=UPI001294CE18|nr:YifB family Mg chelatase-like AAA ATPase [Ornithinicoccus halotolerans]